MLPPAARMGALDLHWIQGENRERVVHSVNQPTWHRALEPETRMEPYLGGPMSAAESRSAPNMTQPEISSRERVPSLVLGWLLACGAVWFWPATEITVPMRVASCAYFAMLTGLLLRRNRGWHVKLMIAAIGTDLGLVLALQLQRSAIQTAITFKLNGWQQAHIGFSTAATLLYVPVLALGWRLARFKGNPSSASGAKLRDLHRRLAVPAFIFRTLGFLLMFSMLASSKR